MPSASAAIEMRPPSSTCSVLTKPLPFFAQQIFVRNEAIAENHFGRVARAHAQLVFFLCRREIPEFPFSTMNAEIPFAPLALSVTAMATQTSA